MALLTKDQFAHLRTVVAFYEAAPDPAGGARSEPARRERFFQASVTRLLQAIEASLTDAAAPAPAEAPEASGILVHGLGYATAIALLGGSEVGRKDGDRVRLAAVERFRAGFEDAFARQLGSAAPNAYEAAREGARGGREAAAEGGAPRGGPQKRGSGETERRDYGKW